jgi:hypothetical protein
METISTIPRNPDFYPKTVHEPSINNTPRQLDHPAIEVVLEGSKNPSSHRCTALVLHL